MISPYLSVRFIVADSFEVDADGYSALLPRTLGLAKLVYEGCNHSILLTVGKPSCFTAVIYSFNLYFSMVTTIVSSLHCDCC